MSFEIGVLNVGECGITADNFSASYEAHKVYLGRNRTLPQSVSVSLTFDFDTQEELKEFFVFWEEKTLHGAKPFYVKLPLFGEVKHYLILLNGEITQKHEPDISISGQFILYGNRTLDENTAPIMEDKTVSVDMDSTNNYILIQAVDYDSLIYEIVTIPSHGVLTEGGGGAYYYTPTDGFSGSDAFVVRVTDELGMTAEATLSINIINWKLNEEFKLVMDNDGHLYIDYVNQTTLDPLVIQAVDELSTGGINSDGEYVIDVSQTQHIDSIVKTADDEWLITPK